jgi:hypothetical protein
MKAGEIINVNGQEFCVVKVNKDGTIDAVSERVHTDKNGYSSNVAILKPVTCCRIKEWK